MSDTAFAASTQAVHTTIEQVVHQLVNSPEFFIEFFLPDLPFKVPDFHIQIFKLMINWWEHQQLALAVPRGHAKTTIAKLVCIYYWLFTDFRFIVYCSNTYGMAAEYCNDIINFIKSENFEAVFGRARFETEREGLFKFHIRLRDGSEKMCMLRAFGLGQQVRGLNIDNERPELGICDDIENSDDTVEPTQVHYEKNMKWFYGAFKKAFSRIQWKLIYIGNLVEKISMLGHFLKSDAWTSVHYGALLENGESLWADLWPIEALRADYKEYKEANMIGRWFAEMMNLPIPKAGGVIAVEEINYQPHVLPEEAMYGFITVDPAISKKTWADNTAIAVHLFNGLRWQIVDYRHYRMSPEEIFENVVELSKQWRIRFIGIEAVAFQTVLSTLFTVLKNINNAEELEFFDLPAARAKTERISAWCTLIKNKTYALNDDDIDITMQLLEYDPVKKNNRDDLIDACAHGATVLNRYLQTVIDLGFMSTLSNEKYKLLANYDVAGV